MPSEKSGEIEGSFSTVRLKFDDFLVPRPTLRSRNSIPISRKLRGAVSAAKAVLTRAPRCAYCGRPIRGKPYTWRGKKFCSKACKRKYREEKLLKRKKRRGGVLLPKDTFGALYWK